MKNLTFVYKKAKFISTALSTVYSEDFFETKKIIKVDLQG
jgi:hypothetical protein